MAKQLPVIIYQLNGKQCMRSMPAKVRQTAGTKKAGKAFGRTSSLAAAILQALEPLVPFRQHREPYNTLFKAMMQWVRNEQENPQQPFKDSTLLTSTRFVKDAGVETRLKAGYSIEYPGNNQVQVHVPAFVPKNALLAPPGCSGVEWKIMAVSCKPKTGEVLGKDSVTISFAYNKTTHAPVNETLQLPMPADSLTLVAFALKYNNVLWEASTRKADRKWMPAGIVSCWWK